MLGMSLMTFEHANSGCVIYVGYDY